MGRGAAAYALTAALAPVRYPVVVGVIAFGLLDPDPAYAPLHETATTDRPTNLDRLVAIGVPIAVGAVITGIRTLPSASLKVAPEINISKNRFPEAAQHIEDAQASGRPLVLTIDRSGATARRQMSLNGTRPIAGMDRDEYPPAMFKEGGAGASVRPVTPGDNRGAGACLEHRSR